MVDKYIVTGKPLCRICKFCDYRGCGHTPISGEKLGCRKFKYMAGAKKILSMVEKGD